MTVGPEGLVRGSCLCGAREFHMSEPFKVVHNCPGLATPQRFTDGWQDRGGSMPVVRPTLASIFETGI